MNIQQLTKMLTDGGVEPNEAKCEIEMLAEFFCGYTEEDKLRGKALSEKDFTVLSEKVRKRVNERIPVQYIIGRAWFMGNFFKVTPDVLIPRDETEILVRKAIELINKYNFSSALDIGTGSGCIACTIAKNTQACVLGTDISSDALRVALDNVTALGINNKAVFRKSDLFDKIREDEKFDIIISNPPYIPENTDLSAEVRHEPKTALFAGENGLEFYGKIIAKAPEYLNSGGYLIFELGVGEAQVVKELMQKSFEDIEIIKDLACIDRIITGKFMK